MFSRRSLLSSPALGLLGAAGLSACSSSGPEKLETAPSGHPVQGETLTYDPNHLVNDGEPISLEWWLWDGDDIFGAFADAYGYEIAGVLLESHSTEGADAPAGHVADLVKVIDEHKIPAVFPDTPGGEEQLKPLAQAAGVEIAPPLYVDTLGDEGSGAETYIDLMRHNVDTIVTALGG